MRTVVLILMIALLPLRMWAADGMGVRMAHAQIAVAAMPADCPMMAMPGAGGESPDDAPSSAHCTTCQLCAATACSPEVAIGQEAVPAGPHQSLTRRFHSAELAPDLRPPIA